MAFQQIKTNQIDGYSAGGGQSTQIATLSGGSGNKVLTFPFVVGVVMLELSADSTDDFNNVITVAHGNMRSFSGTKTADVTNRHLKAFGTNNTDSQVYFHCTRDTSGTRLTISRPHTGNEINVDGTSIASFTPQNWPSTGRLRVTAFEDTQA